MARGEPPFDPSGVIDLDKFRERLGKDSAFGRFLQGKFFLKALGPATAIFILFKVLLFFCFTYIGPNESGIKVVRIALPWRTPGVQPTIYKPGFRWVFKPFTVEEMYRFPHDLQVLDMTGTKEEAAREARVSKPAHIQVVVAK